MSSKNPQWRRREYILGEEERIYWLPCHICVATHYTAQPTQLPTIVLRARCLAQRKELGIVWLAQATSEGC